MVGRAGGGARGHPPYETDVRGGNVTVLLGQGAAIRGVGVRLAQRPGYTSRAIRGVVAAALLLSLSACGSLTTGTASKLTPVTIAMGYFASVQFAPFYVAEARGYYRRAGLEVHLRYGIEPDLLRLAAEGKVDFVDAGGDEVLAAGASGLPVRYVMTQYSRFPSAIFWLQHSGIKGPQGLEGQTVGVPGKYGATYVGLLALLARAHVPQAKVHIQTIGFTQVESVAHHKVDAAVGYAMNEPIELRSEGYRVGEMDVARWANLAGAGIAVSDAEISKRPAVVRAFVQATLHGLRDTLAQPRQAYAISAKAVKIPSSDRVQWQVLKRAIDFWQPEKGHPAGWVDPRIWAETARLLYRFGSIPRKAAPTPYYTNRFVSG